MNVQAAVCEFSIRAAARGFKPHARTIMDPPGFFVSGVCKEKKASDLYFKGGTVIHSIRLAAVIAPAVAMERGWFFRRIRGGAQAAFQLF